MLDLNGQNLPGKDIHQPYLFRKDLYPNRWELELEMQYVFQAVDRWKKLFHSRDRLESLSFSTPKSWLQTASDLSLDGASTKSAEIN
jgi:hypothetical protein